MFVAGQRVWSRNGKHSGTVIECDGDRVYIAQQNGAELDFRASDLTGTPPSGETSSAAPRERGAPIVAPKVVPDRALTPREITPEHLRVLGAVPVRTLRAVADLFERNPKAGRFQCARRRRQAERGRGDHRGSLPHDAAIQ